MKFALNPLQWLATDDGWLDFQKRPPLETLLREVSRLGFNALHAEVPAGMTVTEYREALAAAGITPASGYLSAPLDNVEEREAIVARAEALAETHRELGLTEMFVASSMGPDAPPASPRVCTSTWGPGSRPRTSTSGCSRASIRSRSRSAPTRVTSRGRAPTRSSSWAVIASASAPRI